MFVPGTEEESVENNTGRRTDSASVTDFFVVDSIVQETEEEENLQDTQDDMDTVVPKTIVTN